MLQKYKQNTLLTQARHAWPAIVFVAISALTPVWAQTFPAKPLKVVGHAFSKSALEKLKAAGGEPVLLEA